MRLSPGDYRQVLERVPILCVDGIIVNQQGQFLLVRRRHEPYRGEWWIPGGRVLKGERLEAAFKRKMREELGVEVRILAAVGYYEEQHKSDEWDVQNAVHAVSVVFCAVPLSLDVRLDDQSSEWGFFDELPARLRELGRFNAWLP